MEERRQLREAIAEFVQQKHLVPPVALHILDALAEGFVQKRMTVGTQHQQDGDELKAWLMVEIHNRVWLPLVASIPHDRRLLLLPKCLSHTPGCEAETDELGLLCHRCGRCRIPSLQDEAEELGVLSLVAEGFTSVIQLIENKVVDAVVGVSCLDSLEKAFPLLIGHAVPGLAIPLNIDGCRNTRVDMDYVMELIKTVNTAEARLLNYTELMDTVTEWFTPKVLHQIWDTHGDAVQQIAFDWLVTGGKRKRPFLLAAVYQALTGSDELPHEVQRAAIAVECFHKASLVHDDIQDHDSSRYGKPTVYAEHGEAIAINTGDLLLGQGYRLLASCEHRELLSAVADAHLALCQGQGTELAWTSHPTAVSMDFVLDIFAHKTVPAFEVAIMLALICADRNEPALRDIMKEYCLNMGIAYQMNDDIEDYQEDNVLSHRPTVILAIQSEHPEWEKDELIAEAKIRMEQYRRRALDVLEGLENVELKRLLYQVVRATS